MGAKELTGELGDGSAHGAVHLLRLLADAAAARLGRSVEAIAALEVGTRELLDDPAELHGEVEVVEVGLDCH